MPSFRHVSMSVLAALLLVFPAMSTAQAEGNACSRLTDVQVPDGSRANALDPEAVVECVERESTKCATAYVLCVTAIAVATVACGKDFGLKHCSAVATGGAHAVSVYGFAGSLSWEAKYAGSAEDAFEGTLSGTCSWERAVPDAGSCKEEKNSPAYTHKCAFCGFASAAVEVTTTAVGNVRIEDHALNMASTKSVATDTAFGRQE